MRCVTARAARGRNYHIEMERAALSKRLLDALHPGLRSDLFQIVEKPGIGVSQSFL